MTPDIDRLEARIISLEDRVELLESILDTRIQERRRWKRFKCKARHNEYGVVFRKFMFPIILWLNGEGGSSGDSH